ALLSEKLWAPLGAGDAYVWLDAPGGMARTSGSLFARPEDWLRFGVMLKDGGVFAGKRIVPTAWIDTMTAPSAANASYGLQIWRATPFEKQRWYTAAKDGPFVPSAEPWLDPDMFFFDGFGGQRVYISRAHDLVIARLGRARIDWDDTALPNAVIRAMTR
ncbi:MAG: serine hydrolase, partial [Rhodospirillaceae bacterium]|nr:serine hydrolase [Rhodospirillaceae bacterium]